MTRSPAALPHSPRKPRAVALLSGGLDSTVAAALAETSHGLGLALTVDYGQRAFERERAAARAMAQHFGAEHRTLRLDFLADVTKTALVDRSVELPALSREQLDDVTGAAHRSMAAVWVPNRNGLLIAAAAALAESADLDTVVVGFNLEEATTFPDNSQAFLERTNAALELSTRNHVRVESPTVALDKREIVAEGYRIEAPLHYLWSCYRGGDRHCLQCESCLRLCRALEAVGQSERFFAQWRGGGSR